MHLDFSIPVCNSTIMHFNVKESNGAVISDSFKKKYNGRLEMYIGEQKRQNMKLLTFSQNIIGIVIV